MLKPIAIATAVSGTLDILFAMILTVFFGREIGNMLRYVGSGPFPPALDMGTGGAILGLLVHFSLMAIMAAALMLFVRQRPRLLDRPVILGVVYGIITYAVMNLIVVPLRFDAPLPPSALLSYSLTCGSPCIAGLLLQRIYASMSRVGSAKSAENWEKRANASHSQVGANF
jgi:hypothetical protein